MYRSQEDNSVIKLKQLIASRYGKGLEIRQLMDLAGVEDEESILIRGSDLHIPIQAEGNFLGTAVIPQAMDLSEDKKNDIAQVVRMILKPTLYNWYLERKENNIQQLAEAQFPTENLQLFGEELPNIDDLIDDNVTFDEDSEESPQLSSNLIHLEGKNLLLVKKAAFQLHEMTHRWAFVPFADIRSQVQSVLDISKMGAMTIFVEEVLSLSTEDQSLLVEFMSSPRSDSEPLIITSSRLSMEEIRSSDIHPHLIDEIEVNSFEVDRAPIGYQNLKEVLELFFLRDKDLK